jgi:hypothetical protein
MKFSFLVLCLFFSANSFSAEVITCGDARAVGKEAKLILHKQAQERAQKDIEIFVEKTIKTPIVDVWGNKSTVEHMSALIDVYWCETNQTPLHSAYYRFYSSNKYLFH